MTRKINILKSFLAFFAVVILALAVSGVKISAEEIEVDDWNSLNDAISDASNGDTITLTENIPTTESIEIANNITLNLNEKELSSSYYDAFNLVSFIKYSGSGTLTITGNGTISTNGSLTTSINNAGTGTVDIDSGTVSSEFVAVGNSGGGTVNINGGLISVTAASSNGILNSDGTVNVKGGEVSASGNNSNGISNTDNLVLYTGTIDSIALIQKIIGDDAGTYAPIKLASPCTITGGTGGIEIAVCSSLNRLATIEGEPICVVESGGDPLTPSDLEKFTCKNTNSELVLEGVEKICAKSTLIRTIADLNDAISAASDGDTIKLDGNITTTESITIANNNITLDLNGKTLSGSDDVIVYQGTGPLTITGNGTIEATNGTAILLESGGTLLVANGTIEATNGTAILLESGGSLVVENGTIEATNGTAIQNDSTGSITVESGKITTTGTNVYAISNTNGGTVNINGGTVYASTEDGVAIYNNGGLNVSGGMVTASGENGTAIYNYGGTATVSGTARVTASGEDGTAIYNNAGELNVSETAKITASGADGIAILNSTIGTANVFGNAIIEATNGAVRYNGTVTNISSNKNLVNVSSQIELITAVDYAEDGDEIKLTESITTTGSITIASDNNKNITLDLDGYILSGSDDVIVHQGKGTLTITGGGTIEATNGTAILLESSGSLVVENGTIEATDGTAIQSDSTGTITIEAPAAIEADIDFMVKNKTALKNAISAAKDESVIQLGAEITDVTSSITITGDKDITLDLNDKTLSGSGAVIVHQGTGTLTITGNGKIEATNGTAILLESSGSLVVENGTIEATNGTAIQNDSTGSITIGDLATIEADIDFMVKNEDALNNAISAAKVDSVIQLGADIPDVTSEITITNNNNITLDLNGYTLSGSSAVIVHRGTGMLTIKDSSGAKTGKIEATDGTAIQNGSTGTITVESGKITTTGSFDDTISNTNGGTVNVNGGEVSATEDSSKGIFNSNGTVNVSGGTVSASGVEGTAISNSTSGTLNVSGGTVSATNFIAIDNYGILNVSGGTVSASGAEGAAIYNDGGALNVSAGTVSASGAGGRAIFNSTSGTVNVSGTAKVTASEANGVAIDNDSGTVTVSGNAIIEATNGAKRYNGAVTNTSSNKNLVNVSSLIELITAVDNAEVGDEIKLGENITTIETITITNNKNITLDLNGNTLSIAAENKNLIDYKGTGSLTITDSSEDEDGKLSATGNNGIAIRNYSSGTVNITGGEVSATAGTTVYNDFGGEINISGNAKVTATGDNQTAVGNIKGGTINISGNAKISATGMAICNLGNTGFVNVSDSAAISASGTGGVVIHNNSPKANFVISDNVTIEASGGAVAFSGEDCTVADTVKIVSVIRVADETTLKSALNSAPSGTTIKLTNSILDITGFINITNNNDITLDLNGNILSGVNGAAVIAHQGTGELTIKDSASGGTISSSGGDAVVNNNTGTVTIESGTITSSSGDAIYNNASGTINVKGGTIKSTAVDGDGIFNETGIVNVTGGDISTSGGNGNAITNNGGTIDISGGNISADDNANSIIDNVDGTTTISGGIFSTSKSTGFSLKNGKGKTINISGGDFTGVKNALMDNDGTVKLSGTATGLKDKITGSGKVTIASNQMQDIPVPVDISSEVNFNAEKCVYEITVTKYYEALYSLDMINWTYKNVFTCDKDNTEITIYTRMENSNNFLAESVTARTGSKIAETQEALRFLDVSCGDSKVSFDETATKYIRGLGNVEDLKLEIVKCDDYDKKNFFNYYQRKAVGKNDVFKITLSINGKQITDFDGGEAIVTLSEKLDFEADENSIVYYVPLDGKTEAMASNFDGNMNFVTTHFSHYMMIKN